MKTPSLFSFLRWAKYFLCHRVSKSSPSTKRSVACNITRLKLHLFGTLVIKMYGILCDSIHSSFAMPAHWIFIYLFIFVSELCCNEFHFRETVTNVDISPEEMRSIIEVIAETGKFWYKLISYRFVLMILGWITYSHVLIKFKATLWVAPSFCNKI